jgi:hypothetical protein
VNRRLLWDYPRFGWDSLKVFLTPIFAVRPILIEWDSRAHAYPEKGSISNEISGSKYVPPRNAIMFYDGQKWLMTMLKIR